MQGEELRAIREAAGLSQADMAIYLGLSRVFVGLMERGERPIEDRTERLIEASLRQRIDVAYSWALRKWTVSLTGPGAPGSGVHRTHAVLGAFKTGDAATDFADRLKTSEYPLARVTIFGGAAQAPDE